MTGPIVVGVDGSAEAQAAVNWAAGLAQGTHAEVLAVHAVGLLEKMEPLERPSPAAGHIDEIRQRLEDSWCEPLRRVGVAHRTELRFGSPVEVLLDVAAEHRAGLIVVGRRGTGGANILGSTSAQLAVGAPVPVVIVPAEEASERG